MNILLINQPLNNRGDESAHRALIRQLAKDLQAHIIVMYINCYSLDSMRTYDMNIPQVEYVNIRSKRGYKYVNENLLIKYPYLKFLWSIHPTTRAALKLYKWADVVLCAPGGINMGGFQDWRHMFFLELARYAHKPLIYFGRSFGPFPMDNESQIKFKNFSDTLLKYFAFLSIRDGETEKLATRMGLSYSSTLDTAFLDDTIVDVPAEVSSIIGDGKYMVFVPNQLLWHYSYKDKLSEDSLMDFYTNVIYKILEHNKSLKVVMLPQIYNSNNNDVGFFCDIAKRMNNKNVVVIPDCYSSDIQQMIIRKSEFVIGARYHSIVFAINQGVPFIALSYEHKISGLCATLHQEEYCIDITSSLSNHDTTNKVVEQVSQLLPMLHKDKTVQQSAKAIVKSGYDSFLKSVAKYEK